MAARDVALLRHERADAHAPAATGVWSWITTVDHKRIGILYGVSAFAFFLVGGSRRCSSGCSSRRPATRW